MIDDNEAIQKATQIALEHFGEDSIEGKTPPAIHREGTNIRISFEPTGSDQLGGGPNIVLSADDGSLIEVSSTQ